MKWLFFVVTLAFTAAPNKTCASFEDGFAAAKSGNYLKAYSAFFDGAQKGDAKAQAALGLMYLGSIDGLLIDKGKAAEWLRKAAEQGEREAQFTLGVMYREGKPLKRNYSLAMDWSKKAAEQGHPGAQNNLGSNYYLGKGTKRNYALAADWYKEGAMQGDSEAQKNLGALYTLGEGVAKDLVKGYAWFVLSSRQGDHLAREYKIYHAYDLSYTQINEANELADALSGEISEKVSATPQRDLQVLLDLNNSCFSISDSTERNTLYFNGLSVGDEVGNSWCYSGVAKSGSSDTRQITSVLNKSPDSLKFVKIIHFEETSLSSKKELLKFAKKKKLIDKVFGGKFGKVKYSAEKSRDAVCVSYKRSFSSRKPLTDVFEGLLWGAQVLLGGRGAKFSTHSYANGFGIQCIHPYNPAILISTELIRLSNKSPEDEDKKKVMTDAKAFLSAISFTKLNM